MWVIYYSKYISRTYRWFVDWLETFPYNPLWIDKVKKLNLQPKYLRTTWMTKEEIDGVKCELYGLLFEKF